MNKIVSFFSLFFVELLIILSLLFVVNNFIGQHEDHIGFADGMGYYEYLPSSFIRGDINRKDFTIADNPIRYSQVQNSGIYNEYKNHTVNKYTMGTALLQSPFFAVAYILSNKKDLTGYEPIFHKAIYISTLFYLFLGLYFLKRLLLLFEIDKWVILFSQLALVFATSVISYTLIDSSFSHIYSFFAITLFLFVAKRYFQEEKAKYFIVACALLGLIFILRQVNVIIIFSLPFLAGNWENFKRGISILMKPKWLIGGLLLSTAIISMQLYFWYLQTGDYIVYSYQNEGFNFLHPEFFNILFSYKKGLFIYTPILLLSFISVSKLLVENRYLAFAWLSFFVLITYILSSWHSWEYGCSFGSRPYIDFYAFLFLPFAFFVNNSKRWIKIIVGIVTGGLIYIAVIQTYQYKEYILHWIDMDKTKYWTVFLKTDERYKGLVWKEEIDTNRFIIEEFAKLGKVKLVANSNKQLYSINITKEKFKDVEYIQLSLLNNFEEQNKMKILVSLDGKTNNYIWHERSILHFNQKGINNYHQGLFNYKLLPIISTDSILTLTIQVKYNSVDTELNDFKINLLKSKK